jgi:uncharacterized protein
MRAVVIVLVAAVGLWVVLVLLAWGFQRQLLYLPGGDVAGPVPDDVEELTLRTEDGLDLTAWRVRSDEPAVATVLALPGNAGDRSLRLPLARGLAARGHDVLLIEYRGYGGNPGRPSEEGLHRDADAARAALLEDGIAEDRLVVLGESVGTGVAAGLVARHRPAAVVLRSPFPDLADVASTHYGFLPVRRLLWDRYPIVEQLRDLEDLPVLVVAGGADTIVPTALSREVAEELDAELVELEGVDHNDRALLDGDRYLDAVDGFIRSVLDDSSSDGPGG